ncbi:YjaG family protein [Oscillatoria salina IIICB1]|nr:YjaG family protein [Oscillatoria salina IIICB1]
MGLYSDRIKSLKVEIEKLSPLHRIAFAASCCERLLPNCYIFTREEGQGNPSPLRTALDEVWHILEGKVTKKETIQLLLTDCEKAIVPSDYVLESRYSAESHLAIVAISKTLKACLSKNNVEDIFKVIEVVGDTIFGFLDIDKEITDPDWLQKSWEEEIEEISNHPFTLREIAKQNEDLQKLKEAETLEPKLLEWLRTTSYNNDKSLIDLS